MSIVSNYTYVGRDMDLAEFACSRLDRAMCHAPIFNLLRDSYLYRDKRGRLLPYQKRNNGYLEIKEAFNNSSDWNGVQTLVTPKGREFFRSLYPSV